MNSGTFQLMNGIFMIQVAKSGTYSIDAVSASNDFKHSLGCRINGQFNFKEGDKLYIALAQRGSELGGCGATWVWKEPFDLSDEIFDLLLVAGGAGVLVLYLFFYLT